MKPLKSKKQILAAHWHELNQEERVYGFLLTTETGITPRLALDALGVYRLAATIHRLKAHGIKIVNKGACVTNRFGKVCFVGRYVLAGQKVKK